MNPDLERLKPYPFERLAALLGETPRDRTPISLGMGEPKHPTPRLITDALTAAAGELSRYPVTRGDAALREAVAGWLGRRFRLPAGALDTERHVLPVSGTREALFAFAQAAVDRAREPQVAMPNPFYQIYEGAALLAGADPLYLDCHPENRYRPDWRSIPGSEWDRCQLLYITSPGNPTGATLDTGEWAELMTLAERHDFILAADECYSELYPEASEPPVGLLQAAWEIGNTEFRRCVVFHSLSKRSNAPGLRSGFVAGDADVLTAFLRYRTYQGCAMAPPAQAASIAAWNDEMHVADNRAAYDTKFDAVIEELAPVLPVTRPEAGFYLWPETPIPDTDFAAGLHAREGVTVLPGAFLSRTTDAGNPGRNRVRMALVPPLETCIEAARRIRRYIETL